MDTYKNRIIITYFSKIFRDLRFTKEYFKISATTYNIMFLINEKLKKHRKFFYLQL